MAQDKYDLDDFVEDYTDEDEGWMASAYGDTFICPCGHEIELDGECPEGHVSPLRELGMI